MERLLDTLHPLNKRICKDIEWVWSPQQGTESSTFKYIKVAIANSSTLAHYNPNKTVTISAETGFYIILIINRKTFKSDLPPCIVHEGVEITGPKI